MRLGVAWGERSVGADCPAVDHLIAIVVPDPVAISGVLKHDPNDISGLGEKLQDPEVAQKVLKIMAQTAQKAGLKGYVMEHRRPDRMFSII